MRPYNIELFDRSYGYRSSCQVSDIQTQEDYLSMESNSMDFSEIKAEIDDYITITNSGFKLTGIVYSAEPQDEKTRVIFKPTLSILDIDVLCDTSTLSNVSLEAWVADLIAENYLTSSDSAQNISGLEITVLSSTSGVISLDSNIANMMDIVTSLFLTYGITIDAMVNPGEKKLEVKIENKNLEAIAIEADLPNIIKKKVKILKANESINKLTVINQDNTTQRIIYYKNKAGGISTTNADRIIPVVPKTVFASGDDFSATAYEKAVTTLTSEELNNLIEITTISGDTLVNPEKLYIGQSVRVITKEMSYYSILTGRKVEAGKTTLIFGAIRNQLTKKIRKRG